MEALAGFDGKRKSGNIDVSISIVSHGQIGMVAQLLNDVARACKSIQLEVILTLNLPEVLPFSEFAFPFKIKLFRNADPKGFGANHNQAFEQASGRFFCVLNPDIRFSNNPFPDLLALFDDPSIGLTSPLVCGPAGFVEDSFRRFPSPAFIIKKMVERNLPADYLVREEVIYPEWVAGMFMLFPSVLFQDLKGFDERYFLYYEDVDICARLRLLGYIVAVCPDAKVIHHAQRASHKNLKYLRWHLTSMVRFFLSPVYRQVRIRSRL